MSGSLYYRVHAKPRLDIDHTLTWAVFLLEVDESAQSSKSPKVPQLAVAAAHKIFGCIPLTISHNPIKLDDFEKVLNGADYHIVVSSAYIDNDSVPKVNLQVHTPLNEGRGIELGVFHPDEPNSYRIYSLKDFWQAYTPSLKSATIVTIKDQ